MLLYSLFILLSLSPYDPFFPPSPVSIYQPHGAATWGRENPSTDWNDAAVQIAEYLLKRHSDWPGLVFVEGINYSTDFRGYKDFPIDLGKEEWNDRLVLSPHQYGPSVVELAMFHAPNFPANMPDEWESHWG